MHALFYTLLLMARGCLAFNGTNFAPSHASQLQPSVSQCSLAYYSHLLYVSAREWQIDGRSSIVDSSTSQQFFFWKNKGFFFRQVPASFQRASVRICWFVDLLTTWVNEKVSLFSACVDAFNPAKSQWNNLCICFPLVACLVLCCDHLIIFQQDIMS